MLLFFSFLFFLFVRDQSSALLTQEASSSALRANVSYRNATYFKNCSLLYWTVVFCIGILTHFIVFKHIILYLNTLYCNKNIIL